MFMTIILLGVPISSTYDYLLTIKDFGLPLYILVFILKIKQFNVAANTDN